LLTVSERCRKEGELESDNVKSDAVKAFLETVESRASHGAGLSGHHD
jgi:hypothetical protein